MEDVPDGYYKCRMCDKWISVFPRSAKYKSRYYAQQHCLSIHFQQMIWECDNGSCARHKTKTWKAMHLHQQRRHRHRTGVIRLVTKEEEEASLKELLEISFPQVPFPSVSEPRNIA